MRFSVVFPSLLCASVALAGVEESQTLPYRGRLEQNGVPYDSAATGPVDLTFELWDDPMAGTSVWGPETHSNVTVAGGAFAVELGAGTPTAVPIDDAALAAAALYLQMSVNGTALQGRQKLAPVGHARRAAWSNGADQCNRSDGSSFAPIFHVWGHAIPSSTAAWTSWGAVETRVLPDPGLYRITIYVNHNHTYPYDYLGTSVSIAGSAARRDNGALFRNLDWPVVDPGNAPDLSRVYVAYVEAVAAGDTVSIEPSYVCSYAAGAHNLWGGFVIERVY